MCGIAGIFDLEARGPIDDRLLSGMSESLIHRGPDDCGSHIEPGIGLAHRRLSIIDLSGGHQPMFNEDGSVAVVYNGEIYNFQELAKGLAASGHSFRTRCDTEVIVHAWEEWAEDCVSRFRGMFAFALWDRRAQILFLARDRLGIKPLYYAYLPDGQFIFASELKGLLVHPGLPREVEPRSVEEYFSYGYIPEPRTILRHAFKLLPGHTLTIKRGDRDARPREYWDVPFQPLTTLPEREVVTELVERMREAVRIRLISDVPLGAFLSGGVDSSSVVAMMASVSPDPVNTCSISFGDPRFNEASYAAQVAKRYHTRHSVEHVNPDDFELIDKLAQIYDEPFADSSAMPTFRVCQLARRHVKVALSGDGGDENLGGYSRYRWHLDEERARNLVPPAIRRTVFASLGTVYPNLVWAPKIFRAKSTLQALARDWLDAYFDSVSIMDAGLRSRLFSPAMQADLQGYQAIEVLRRHAQRAPEHPLSRVQYLDMKTYLVGDILTKVDRASMANSLEVRVPLLDHELVEWFSRLPPDLKLRSREGKYIFKRALRPYLPDNILHRPKMGFAVPLATWFRGPLRERVRDALLNPGIVEGGLFNVSLVEHIVEEHESGRRDYSAAIWALLMFEAFQTRVLQAPSFAAACK